MACHAAHSADQAGLIKARPGDLCLSCHSGTAAVLAEYKVKHAPVANQECSSCHSGHGSPHAGYLIKGQPALCLGCHREVAKFWQEGATHPPAAEDCTTCHGAHGSNHENLLAVSPDQLCARCHDLGTARFINVHQGFKPRPTQCVSCHDPHGGPKKNLLYPVSHGPFAPGNCTPCHEGRTQ
jgi:predicted CXXCH cytochrome family protein